MIEDGIVHGNRCINQGSPALFLKGISDFKKRLKKPRMRCGVADDPVVVLKFQPEKHGDGVEDKTETTGGISAGAIGVTKSPVVAKG